MILSGKEHALIIRLLRWFVLLVALSFWFTPYFYALQLVLTALSGLLLLFLYRFRSDRFVWRFTQWKDSSNLLVMFVFVTFSLAFRLTADFYIYAYDRFWFPWILSFFFVVVVFVDKARLSEKDTSVLTLVATLVLLAGFSYGMVLGGNYLLNRSAGTQISTRILDKSLTSGPYQLHEVQVEPWEATFHPPTLTVDHTTYQMKIPGDTLHMVMYEGGFGIPYYFVLY